jgi:hypothetical protein
MRLLLFIFCFFPAVFLSAQYAPSIRSIRPGSTTGTYTIGAKVIQIQSGIQFRNREGIGLDQNTVLFKNALRFGLTNRTELNAVITWQQNTPDDPIIDGASIEGISTLRVGGRVNVVNKKEGFFRGLGINGRIWMKAPTKSFRSDKLGGRIVFAGGFALPAKIRMGLNTGLVWRGNNGGTESLYGLRLLRGFGKTGIVVETFGLTDRWEPDFGVGLYYLVDSNFKLDFYSGFLGEEGINDRFIEFGISWRFRYK